MKPSSAIFVILLAVFVYFGYHAGLFDVVPTWDAKTRMLFVMWALFVWVARDNVP